MRIILAIVLCTLVSLLIWQRRADSWQIVTGMSAESVVNEE